MKFEPPEVWISRPYCFYCGEKGKVRRIKSEGMLDYYYCDSCKGRWWEAPTGEYKI